MKTHLILASALIALNIGSAFAQSHNHATHGQSSAAPSSMAAKDAPSTMANKDMPKEMTDAEVRKVDKEAKKVTLKHGPIKNLEMPGMTMVFQVRDDKLFDKLINGEKIKFTAEQLQGAFVITSVEKADAK